MQKGDKYWLCPECNKRGVYLKLLPHNEDNYRCRYCTFYFFATPSDFNDISEMNRFLDANKLKEMP